MTTISVEHLYKAQFGEDRVLWQVFRRRSTGYFIEVGAYDGVTLSNTYFLEQMGWCGLLVEPILPLCRKAAAIRPRSRVVHAACSRKGSHGTATFTVTQNVPVLSFLKADQGHVDRCLREGAQLVEIEVPVTSLDDILLQERKKPTPIGSPWVPNVGWRIDLVSIDTEGCELDVLDGFDVARFRPRILVIENDREAGQAIKPYLSERGYHKFHRQKINDFYVRADDPAEDLTLSGFTVPG
ncbi:MAG: FkbM family methyltransferase [Phycisphaerales bacterium]|nr:MAG: FkbM family methyltransferase [Phycisphaerales bacterium]